MATSTTAVTSIAPTHAVHHSQRCTDGDQAWMLMATVLVLGMFPGVGFFEAGLLRHKTTTTILAQVFCGLAMLSVMWFSFGYSLTLSPTGTNGFIGDLNNAFFINVDFHDCHTASNSRSISTGLFGVFQLMFACITPLLMTGAYAERLAWTPFVLFTIAWEILVYYPVAHWMWSDHGWLAKMGALDFAGGIVIHTTAGVSSLVVCAMLGRRQGFDERHGVFPYSSLPNAAIGCTLLWTGWFGFNGGSAFASNTSAVYAVVNSQIGATFAACAYMIVIMIMTRTPSTIAIMNGAVAGLAGITPASGYLEPPAAMILGVILGLSVEPCVHILKHKLRIDDALDVSIVHGLTGIIGSLYIGFAATRKAFPGIEYEGVAYYGDGTLLGMQLLAVTVCGAWSAAMSAIILKAVSLVAPLRISEGHEKAGMDVSVFRERSVHYEPEDRLHFHGNHGHGHGHGDASAPLLNNASGLGSTRGSVYDASHNGPGAAHAAAGHSHSPRGGSTRSSMVHTGRGQQGPLLAAMAQHLTQRRVHDRETEDPLRPEEQNSADRLLDDLQRSFAAAAFASGPHPINAEETFPPDSAGRQAADCHDGQSADITV